MLKVRFYAGLSFFVLAWILPLFSILVAKLNLALSTKAVIIGLLTLGGPELLGLLAVLCLGKENLLFIKKRIFTWLKRLKPAAIVSRTRYRFGLVMFLLPIIPTYIMAYVPQWLPVASHSHFYVNLAAYFVFLSSLFVLGGDFWDKLRALFMYDAWVEFGPRTGTQQDGTRENLGFSKR